jgi:nitroreductase
MMKTETNRNAVIETILSRRSIRSYGPEQISDAALETLLQCAVNAPSALNMQPWEIRVVQAPGLLKRINDCFVKYAEGKDLPGSASKAQTPGFSVFHGAPTLIIVAGDEANAYSPVDCGLLGQNILLAAESMDIGTCVIGSVVACLNTPEAASVVRELDFPAGYRILYAIATGYKNQRPDAKPRETGKVRIIR